MLDKKQLKKSILSGNGSRGISKNVKKLLDKEYRNTLSYHQKIIMFLMDSKYLTMKDDFDVSSACGKLIIQHHYKQHNVHVTVQEGQWLYHNNLQEPPKCAHCKEVQTVWSQKQKRFKRHCSTACRSLDPAVEQKRKKTCLERYGHDKSFKSKNHLKTSRITHKIKTGVEFPLQLKSIRDKGDKTKEDNYGKYWKEHIHKKAMTSLAHKHDIPLSSVGEMFSTHKFMNKKRKTYLKNWLPLRMEHMEDVVPLFNFADYVDTKRPLPYKCTKCLCKFIDKIHNGSNPRCPSCYPRSHNVSKSEHEVVAWLRQLIPNCQIITNDRTVLNGKELDILIPEHKIAIELNGLYWHSETGSRGRVSKQYHLKKTNQAAQDGYSLIHIFEDEWIHKNDLVKSIIKNKLGIRSDTIVYARKTTVVDLSSHTARQFIDNNHIQGYCNSSVRLGLMFGDEIVMVMTFGKNRFDKKIEWELYRLCTKKGTTVVGGASKLFKYFLNHNNVSSIVSYSDKRFFTGNVYEMLQFTKENDSPPGYYYVHIDSGCSERLSRHRFQKHKLDKLLPNFEPELSEHENMSNAGYSRLWNCGHGKWVMYF